MFNEIYFTEIDAYVSGNMTPDERTAFENRLKTEPDLATELADFQQVLGNIEPIERQQLRHQIGNVAADLKADGFFEKGENSAEGGPLSWNIPTSSGIKDKIADIHAELGEKGFFEPQNDVKTRRFSIWQYAAAASIALLIGVGFWLFSPKKTDNTGAIVAAAFQSETAVPEVIISKLKSQTGMASGEASDADLLRCLELYKAKNYAAARPALQQHIAQFGNQSDVKAAQFYYALACIGDNKELEKAIPILENLRTQTAWASDASWFLALAYLQNGRYTEGSSMLKKIAESNDSFKKESIELLQKLDKK
jgi:TolA-binding protein